MGAAVLRLSELIDGGTPPKRGVVDDVEIRGLSADSREVEQGFLFAALHGTHAEGIDFIPDAIRRGAVAILAPTNSDVGDVLQGTRLISDPNPRKRLALMAARFFARQPKVVAAVTGTNGKTSVAEFTRQIWNSVGLKAGSLGSLGVCADGIARPANLTTPDPISLHRLLKEIADAGVEHLAMEASSHGLDQHRLDGVRISSAAFLNLTRDHFDYHPTVESYLAAKARLFGEVMIDGGSAVLNRDAPEYDHLSSICRSRGHGVLSFGTNKSDIRLIEQRADSIGQRLELEVLGQRHKISVPLPGAFQAYNMLAALGLAIASGVDATRAVSALPHLRGVRGRLEEAARHPSGAPIYVDYAHTPNALEAALVALRPYASNRLIAVFGCGGDRDKGKRAQMGECAATLADVVYVTDDNPRSEDPAAIRGEIMRGCPTAAEIGDRAEAIRTAVSDLGLGDVLIVAGKGHEQGQAIGERVITFDDVEVAQRAIALLKEGCN